MSTGSCFRRSVAPVEVPGLGPGSLGGGDGVLRGRATEVGRLDELLKAARAGQSGALVIRGEAGIGKTALLGHVASCSEGALVLHAEGVEADMELPFAVLHQLCAPLLEALDRLPTPQRDALQTAFGLSSGSRPDRFLVGLAVLTLFSDAAETQPLVCLVDDAQWLDRSSAQVLSFVARRLGVEGVLMLFGERDSNRPGELTGLPDVRLQRLSYADARELLESGNLGVLDERVRDRIIAETRGNPLALLELPRALSPAGLAGGFAVSDGPPLEGRIEASFRRRVEQLPEETQRLLLLGAAEPLGDPTLLWQAAAELGLRTEAAAPAEAADLIALGTRVTFRHPLLRSAIYRAAPSEQRRAAHRALADATQPELDPDRRAWHRAHATLAPDEEVAAELEHSAERARGRGGLAAAAAFLERAAELTPDPRRRAQRALGAARRKRLAGLTEVASTLLATAEQGPLNDLERALSLRLRGQIAEDMGRCDETSSLLLDSARRLEPLDIGRARETYLEALFLASNAGRFGGGVAAPARIARAAPPPPGHPDTTDLLLDGLAVLFTEGHAAAAPLLKRALASSRDDRGRDEHAMRGMRIAARVAAELFDELTWDALATRHAQIAREDGVLSVLPVTLNYLAALRIYQGDLEAAAILLDESDSISRAATGAPGDVMRLLLAAYRGDETQTSRLCEILDAVAAARREGLILTVCEYATAILQNSLGQYERAVDAAQRATALEELSLSPLALPELVEAAARSGQTGVAANAFERLAERTRAAVTDFAHGMEARSRALVSEGAVAEAAYRDAIDAFGKTSLRMFLARAQLLYGEWLRRANRRTDARVQLGAAHEFFTRVGADGFAGRAARELLATGSTPRKRRDETRANLTAQEAQIATLARDGHTNPEIGAQLFLSPRTVEWHLRNVFMKLGIRSRRDLRSALPRAELVPTPV
jgi:DNA-binding CsgD family transcriptional regulator